MKSCTSHCNSQQKKIVKVHLFSTSVMQALPSKIVWLEGLYFVYLAQLSRLWQKSYND